MTKHPREIEADLKKKYDTAEKEKETSLKPGMKKILLAEKKRQEAEEKEYAKRLNGRLKDPELYEKIINRFHKDHIGDDNALGCVFITILTSRQKPAFRNSIKGRGETSVGKTHLVKDTIIKHIPPDWYTFVTRCTRATLEDNLVVDYDLIVQLEKHEDKHVNETVKQIMEDGIRIVKKDMKTGELKDSGYIPRKTVIDTSTTEESDDEVANRALIMHIGNDSDRLEHVGRMIDDDAMSMKIANTGELLYEHTWITDVLLELKPFDKILIPFANEIPIAIDHPRKQRDKKRFYNMIRAIAWLFQFQRKQETNEDGHTYLIATKEDYELAAKITKDAFIRSVSGISPKLDRLIEILESNEVVKVGLEEIGDFNDDWVLRKDVEEIMNVTRLTIQRYVKHGEELGFIESYKQSMYNPQVYVRVSKAHKVCPLLDVKEYMRLMNQ